ncbi:hypothetical protein C8F01DRAFT_1370762 [Mycena amicta]|nr:hypothetical protein C8F01DRAFT_1370762 [Mycena amicta]
MVQWNKILAIGSIGAGAALLGLVAFDVPFFKQVYFLRIELGTTTPFVDLGALGFCTNLQDGRGLQCSPLKIGYNLSETDHFLQGNASVDLTHTLDDVVTGGLTKVLALHLVACGISVLALAFALFACLGVPCIATCCSVCFSGFAGAAAFAVFAFDVAFFLIIKSRIQTVAGHPGAVVMDTHLFGAKRRLVLQLRPPPSFHINRIAAGFLGSGSRGAGSGYAPNSSYRLHCPSPHASTYNVPTYPIPSTVTNT